MQTPPLEEQVPRFYQIGIERDLLDGWLVVKEWGFVGSSGRVIQQHFKHIEDAEHELQRTRDSQSKRGYRVVFVQGQSEPR